jgi:hypothetical protein
VKQGSRVRCTPTAKEATAEAAPPGRWWVVSPAPGAGYWLAPDDDAARSWASGTGQKFLQRNGRHIAPAVHVVGC